MVARFYPVVICLLLLVGEVCCSPSVEPEPESDMTRRVVVYDHPPRALDYANPPRATHSRVYSEPPTDGWWKGSNQLGQGVAFQQNQNNRQRILQMPEWGPPDRWTISLGVEFGDDLDANHVFEAQGNIKFGVGGAQNQVDVDWVTGTTLSVVANTITIDAVWTALTVNGPPANVRLLAEVCRGNSSYLVSATNTVATGSIAAAATFGPRRIPNFARRVHVLPLTGSFSNAYNPANFLRFSGDSVGTTSSGAIFGDTLKEQVGSGVVIPGQSKFWLLTNNDANPFASMVVFDIEP